MFNTLIVLNTATVGTNICLQLPVEGSSALPVSVPAGGKGDIQSPGLLQATYPPKDRDRSSESPPFTFLLLSIYQENIFLAELKYDSSLHWKTNEVMLLNW